MVFKFWVVQMVFKFWVVQMVFKWCSVDALEPFRVIFL